MIQRKNGLNDSDKVLVTFALWMSAVILFATALTLPMLPDKVTIFYRPDVVDAEPYSKYNNLFIILVAIIPAAIVLISATFKKRNRLQGSFLSVILFSVMLSLCMASVIIYGIMQQFDSSSSIKHFSLNGFIAILIAFVLSMTAAFMPMVINTKIGNPSSPFKKRVYRTMIDHWNIGAYGFILCAIACSFTPDLYCYIPLAVAFIAHIIFLFTFGIKKVDKAD